MTMTIDHPPIGTIIPPRPRPPKQQRPAEMIDTTTVTKPMIAAWVASGKVLADLAAAEPKPCNFTRLDEGMSYKKVWLYADRKTLALSWFNNDGTEQPIQYFDHEPGKCGRYRFDKGCGQWKFCNVVYSTAADAQNRDKEAAA